ncbi:MAG: dihydrolipoyl dehydrogenase family protein [Rhizobiaceae bacterium]
MPTLTPDICILGAGSGGLSVAAAAAAFGVDVVLVEKGKMGGDCLNYGCVPSKAILASGKTAQAMRESGKFGIEPVEPKVDFQKVHDHIHDVIAAIEPNDSVERFTGLGVKVIQEAGKFKDEKTLVAGEHEIRARRFVVATGSSAFVPPIPGLEDISYLTNETIFDNTKKIRHLIVIGGGPIGMEMAQAHRRLGCDVTVIEGLTALGKDDPELTAIVLDNVREEGIRIIEGAMVSSVSRKGKSEVQVKYKANGTNAAISGTHLLVATGRAANVEGLGLENAGIEFDRHGIKTGTDLRTTNKRAYAIGDVAGGLQFTHVAGYHAGLVIRGILFRLKAKPDNHLVPWVTYTDPELGQVGLTEEDAREKYGNIQVLRWPYHENDRAQAERKTEGLIKMITTKRGRILGVSIAGANAGEMINMWAFAITNKMKLGNVVGYIPPYPTMGEIGKRAAMTSYAPFAKKPIVRWLVGFLRKFG